MNRFGFLLLPATILMAAFLSAGQTPAASGASPGADEIVRRSVERTREVWNALKDYTFTQVSEERQTDGDGKVTKAKRKTEEILIVEGQPFARKIAVDGRPLTPEEQQQENERMEFEIKKRSSETPEERKARLEAYEESRKERGAILDEIPKAFSFKLAGSDTIDGRAYVVEAYPNPHYDGHHKYSKYLAKLKGKLWIDKRDYHWAKVDAESIGTVSIGWVVARIQEGAKVEFRLRRADNDMWLPETIRFNAMARILLVKKMGIQTYNGYSDYRKFQPESKVAAAPEPSK